MPVSDKAKFTKESGHIEGIGFVEVIHLKADYAINPGESFEMVTERLQQWVDDNIRLLFRGEASLLRQRQAEVDHWVEMGRFGPQMAFTFTPADFVDDPDPDPDANRDPERSDDDGEGEGVSRVLQADEDDDFDDGGEGLSHVLQLAGGDGYPQVGPGAEDTSSTGADES